MQELLYEYLTSYDPSIFPSDFLSLVSPSSLNTCQLTILSQLLCKSLLSPTPFPHTPQLLHTLFTHNHLDLCSQWGLILALLTHRPIPSQKYQFFYFNRNHPKRITYLLMLEITLFQETLLTPLVLAIQQSLQTISTQGSTVLHLFTFQSLLPFYLDSSPSSTRSPTTTPNEKQHFILTYLLSLYSSFAPSLCHLFIQFIPQLLIDIDFITYGILWIKQTIEKHHCSPEIMQVFEIICKAINYYEKEIKEDIFTREEIVEIPYLYHLYVKYVMRGEENEEEEGKGRRRFGEFEKAVHKYSDITKLCTLFTKQFLSTHETALTQHFASLSDNPQLSTPSSPSLFNFFLNPSITWRLYLKKYLEESSISFKKETSDPTVFLLVKKELWGDEREGGILGVCLWLSMKEWKERLGEHPKKREYVRCLEKVVGEFLRELPGKWEVGKGLGSGLEVKGKGKEVGG